MPAVAGTVQADAIKVPAFLAVSRHKVRLLDERADEISMLYRRHLNHSGCTNISASLSTLTSFIRSDGVAEDV